MREASFSPAPSNLLNGAGPKPLLRLLEPLLDASYAATKKAACPRAWRVSVSRLRPLLLALLGAALFLAPGCVPNPVSGDAPVQATVVRVTDGDTFRISPEVKGESAVRLIGLDTPEKDHPLGPEATAFTEENLLDEEISLELDVEEKDDYGRLLAYAYLPDGSMFNETLLREGYAQVATFPPNTLYLDRFEDAQEEAREAGRGIWGLPEGDLCRLRDRGNGIGGC